MSSRTPVVNQLLLFISSASSASKPCIQFIYNSRIPVEIIRLDTAEARKCASQGRLQITCVPSLVVIYQDGNTQLFVGQDKIIYWLTNFIKAVQQGQQHQTRPTQVDTMVISDDSQEEEEEEIEQIKPKKKKKTKKKKKSSQIEIFDDDVPLSPTQMAKQRIQGLVIEERGGNVKMKNAKSLQDMASRMAREREETLGYKESDLPASY